MSLANNQTHVVRFDNLGNNIPGMDDAVLWALNSSYNPTDMIAYRNEADAYPDVWVSDNNYGDGGGIAAWAVCPSTNTGTGGTTPNRWCRGQEVHFNSYWASIAYQDYLDRQATACHELGHTVGLRHRTTKASCMYLHANEAVSDELDGHDIAHINARY